MYLEHIPPEVRRVVDACGDAIGQLLDEAIASAGGLCVVIVHAAHVPPAKLPRAVEAHELGVALCDRATTAANVAAMGDAAIAAAVRRPVPAGAARIVIVLTWVRGAFDRFVVELPPGARPPTAGGRA